MTAGSNPIFDYDGEDELEGLAPREQVISDEELPDFEVSDFDEQDEEIDESLPDVEADDEVVAKDGAADASEEEDDWGFVLDEEETPESDQEDGGFGFEPMTDDSGSEVEGWSELSSPSSEDDEAFDAFEDMSEDEVRQRMADESEAPDWGEEVARAKADEGEELDLDELEEDDEEPKKKNGSKFAKLSENPVAKGYLAFADLLVKVLCFPLALLGKLPFVGKFARLGTTPLATILRKLKVVLPVLLVVGVLVVSNLLTVPRSTKAELPDEGAVVMSEFAAEGKTVTAKVTNEGETIGYVTPTFYVHKTTIHPFTWLKPVRYLKCVGEPLEVDIDSSITAKATCSEAVDGFGKRVSGELNG